MKKKIYNINNFTYEEKRVYSLIGKNKTNKSSMEYITSLTGYSRREARDIIRNLRKKGVPICSQITNGGGYWIELNKKEFGKFVHQQKTEVEGYIKSLEVMVNIYKNLEGDDPNELFI